MPQNAERQIKAFHSLFHGKHNWGACRGVAFNLFVCFGSVLIKGFSKLLPFFPVKTFQTPLCFSPLSFYLFNLWKEPKGVPNISSPQRAGFSTGLQMPVRTQTGSSEARQVLSIIQHVKKEGERKRGRVKAGSVVGGKSPEWTGGISSPWLLKGVFLDICPDTCRVKEAG